MDPAPLYISLATVSTATLIAFFAGLYAARVLVRADRRIRGVLDTLFTLPMVLPPTVVGFFLLLIFGKNSLIGRFLLAIGYQIVFSWPATVIAAFVVAFPMVYRTACGAFEQVDISLIHAARTLGMSERRIFWHVTMPLAWPGVAAGVILGFARALGEFGATMMIAGNIPGRTQTIPVAIYYAVSSGDMEKAWAWVGIIVAVSFAVIVLMNYWTSYRGKIIMHQRSRNGKAPRRR